MPHPLSELLMGRIATDISINNRRYSETQKIIGQGHTVIKCASTVGIHIDITS